MNAPAERLGVTTVDDSQLIGIGDAPYYEQWYGARTPEWYAAILSDVVRYGRPGSLLDLGCGTGLLVELAVRWGIDVLGIDGSEAAIDRALARNRFLPVRHGYLSSALPVRSESFDNAILNQVIEHLPVKTMELVLAECGRILRPGGGLFVLSPSRANRGEIHKDPTHCHPLLPSELRQSLRAARFDVFLEPNAPRFFANNRAISWIARRMLIRPIEDWLSGTANAYARRQ